MPANTDREELVSSTLFQIAGLYSIMVASLLTVFIQQDCGTTVCVGSGASAVCTTELVACSFEDNLGVKTRYGKLVVAFNFGKHSRYGYRGSSSRADLRAISILPLQSRSASSSSPTSSSGSASAGSSRTSTPTPTCPSTTSPSVRLPRVPMPLCLL
jgi:hypothetical protein